jgi:hypothetical protein
MKKLAISAIPAVILLSACSTTDPRLPQGVYREQRPTVNFIDVSANQMRVHIDGKDDRDKDGKGLIFPYGLWSNGTIILQVKVSGEFFYGYPSLHYRWDGERLFVRDLQSQQELQFLK